MVRYFLTGTVIWAGLTLALVVIPSTVVMVLSMRWHLADKGTVPKTYWVAHICQSGIMHRYMLMFQMGLKARRSGDLDDFDELYHQQSDVCMLRMFESFLESAPQLILQVYIMLSVRDYSTWTALTAFTSMVSLGWGIAAYTKAMRNTRLDKHKMTISGLVLQTVWRAGMIGARVLALALVATVIEGWLLLCLGLHLSAMFVWVVSQKTGFSATQWEESIFNFIMAVTYCFCFFNLREGHSRWRMLTFYVVTVTENLVCVIIYFFYASHSLWLKYAALISVSGLMVLGLSCMMLYYRFFHPMGPLNPFQSQKSSDLESGIAANTQVTISSDSSTTPDYNVKKRPVMHKVSMKRTFKSLYPVDNNNFSVSVLSAQGISLESSPATSSSSPTSSSLPQPVYQRPSGTMCSVQDLLANVSCTSDFQPFESPAEGRTRSTSGSSRKEAGDNAGTSPISPSSFERTVNRELEFRLSSSEFQVDRNSSPGETDTQEQERIVVPEQSDSHTEVGNAILEVSFTEPHTQCLKEAKTNEEMEEKDTSEGINIDINSTEPESDRADTSSLKRKCDGHSSYSSPNCVGLPLLVKSSSHSSLHSCMKNDSHRRSASILRTSIRRKGFASSESDVRLTSLPHLTTSTINVTSKSQHGHDDLFEVPAPPPPHVPNVELAVIDRMHIIETESSGVSSDSHSDYENIYKGKDDPRKTLPPKPANLVIPALNETQTSQSSVPHDYENICAININREMLGVRHWKTYSDIEDRVHDYSTYRERLKMLDSTLASSYCSDVNSTLKAIHSRRSISAPDDCESILSRSLPDLSALRLETCLEEAEPEPEEECASPSTKDDNRLMEVLDRLRAARPLNKSSSVDQIPNYETIWVGDVEKPEQDRSSSLAASSTSRSSLVVTIGDVREKESLCNLYYSTMSDLSFRYYSERMRRNCSTASTSSRSTSHHSTSREMTRAISVPDNKTLLEVSQLIEEQKILEKGEGQIAEQRQALGAAALSTPHVYSQTTPLRATQSAQPQPRRKFSMLREKFEQPNWTPLKSPLRRRQSAQRRNSLQDRTARALQAGMKVFRRPRVHVITPKKEEGKDTPRLKSPFKTRTVTPTSTTIRVKGDTPTEVRVTIKGGEEISKAVQRTPQVNTPINHRLAKGTPKTSTPDETKPPPRTGPAAVVDPKVKKISEGPKTSTPEGNKALPQISILSAVSSVVPSPDSTQVRVPLSENIYLSRISSKTLAMQVNKESESTQKSTQSGKSFTNLQAQRSPTGDENSQRRLTVVPSASVSQSHLDLRNQHTSPIGGHRYPGGQAMFSGALGLPRFEPEPRATIVSVTGVSDTAHGQHISHIVLSSPQSPKINMQKSTLSPTSKIFSRRI